MAEQSGWDGVFIWDHVAYRELGWPVADPQVAVAALAATTKHVRLGVLMLALPRRRPWKVARELASLDVLSAGRATFGAGLGSQALQEYEAFGEQGDAKVRAERLDEALEVVVGLWSGVPFTYQGKYYTVTNGQFLPRPVQQPRIPVWIAGRWPARRPFARAARWDGVFPTHVDVGPAQMMSPVQLEDIVTYTAESFGRSVRRNHRGPHGRGGQLIRGSPNRRLRGCRTHLVGREARMVSRLGGRYAPARTSRSAAEVRQRQRTTPCATSHSQPLSAASRCFAGLIQFSQASAVSPVRNERSGADDEGQELRRIGKAGVCPKRRLQPASRHEEGSASRPLSPTSERRCPRSAHDRLRRT